ncbi:hypothetical protein ABZ599_37345 [Streptomyces misionensis]|uniref:hypothetical protein n=1 Tax=Streptomyces misionensis TaxID=67331 RepID=UPI0033FD7A1C
MPMPSRTRTLKFTAVVAFVVLSLTGFSRGGHYTGHHYGHGSHSGGGGGGCSSSHQDHDATHSDYDDEEDFGDDGSGSGTGDDATPTPDASTNAVLGYGTVELVGCATAKKPYATVEITNPTDREDTFTARVNFVADDDLTISFGSTDVTLPAHGTRTVKVPFGEDADLDSLDHCEAQPDAYPVD